MMFYDEHFTLQMHFAGAHELFQRTSLPQKVFMV